MLRKGHKSGMLVVYAVCQLRPFSGEPGQNVLLRIVALGWLGPFAAVGFFRKATVFCFGAITTSN